MIAKELIKILKENPDSYVSIRLGNGETYPIVDLIHDEENGIFNIETRVCKH